MVSILSLLSEPSAACLMCSGRLLRPGKPFIPRGSKLGLRSNPNLFAACFSLRPCVLARNRPSVPVRPVIHQRQKLVPRLFGIPEPPHHAARHCPRVPIL